MLSIPGTCFAIYLVRRSNANTELCVKAAQRQQRTKERWILKDRKFENVDNISSRSLRADFADRTFWAEDRDARGLWSRHK